jgi:monoamine oxidase
MATEEKRKDVVGSVMVVGGGIAGIQASLDLADSGYLVKMIESKSAIGGVMAQLDKTFPTNDCAMCVISPKLVECRPPSEHRFVHHHRGRKDRRRGRAISRSPCWNTPAMWIWTNARPAASAPRSAPSRCPTSST